MECLPDELVLYVVHAIPRFSVYDLSVVILVCKRWRLLILGDRSLRPWGRVRSSYLRMSPSPRLLPYLVLEGEREEYASLLSLVTSREISRVHLEAPINELFLEFAMLFLEAGVSDLHMAIRSHKRYCSGPTERKEGFRYIHDDSYVEFLWNETLLKTRLLIESTPFLEKVLQKVEPETAYLMPEHVHVLEKAPSVVCLISQNSQVTAIPFQPSNLREIHLTDGNVYSNDPRSWDVLCSEYRGVTNVTSLRATVDCSEIEAVRSIFPHVHEFHIIHYCNLIGREWVQHVQEFRNSGAREGIKYHHLTYDGGYALFLPLPYEILRRISSYLSVSETVRFCHALNLWDIILSLSSTHPVPVPILQKFPNILDLHGPTLVQHGDDLSWVLTHPYFQRDVLLPLHEDLVDKVLSTTLSYLSSLFTVSSASVPSKRILVKTNHQTLFRFYDPETKDILRALISSCHPVHGFSIILPRRFYYQVLGFLSFFRNKDCTPHEVHTTLY